MNYRRRQMLITLAGVSVCRFHAVAEADANRPAEALAILTKSWPASVSF
jgi:hypothetical protein